jgi:ABC-type Mn2+/Zn2+ transport system ATPase subunit
MRLNYVNIRGYKNLKNLKVSLNGESFIEVFVGKNGSGKSNFFEAILEIFRHLKEYDAESIIPFDFTIKYELSGLDVEISSVSGKLIIQGQQIGSVNANLLPNNILIYYSGHNDAVLGLVSAYEQRFKSRIRNANFDESRFFIGVSQEYKELLLSTLLIQKPENNARRFVCDKLEIDTISPEVKLILKRPSYASNKPAFNILNNDYSDRYWKADGIIKEFLGRITKCISPDKSTKGRIRTEGYLSGEDKYILYFNIDEMQREFSDYAAADFFRLFDNLKTLDMLEEINVAVKLKNGSEASISNFSDGQFQSVYIYSVIELFKDKNCLTLLDEPDSFLHPEWQFDFLKQIDAITENTAKNNHVLMSSHSAVTLIPHVNRKVKYFEIQDGSSHCYELPKRIAIKKLSSELIRYSEEEQLLSIINTIQIEKKPVLFTEGSTDPIILTEAWNKLYDKEIPFIPFYAFSCTYIKQLLTDDRIHGEMDGLPIFALFDFDKAFDQWNGLDGEVLQNDPDLGLIKKWKSGDSFAFMLPIPQNAEIREQVMRNESQKETFGGSSICEIEHIFYGAPQAAAYYHKVPSPGGKQVAFKSDRLKVRFAKEVVPTISKEHFEIFRPIFEFIESKI